MGGTGWSYFVPYQEDIDEALETLRQQALDNGDYHLMRSREDTISYLESELAKPLEMQFGYDSHEDRDLLEYLRRNAISKLEGLKELSEPLSNQGKLAEIALINEEGGARSILDMIETSLTPMFGTISPLTSHQLNNIFGSDKPTRADIEAIDIVTATEGLRDRWEGGYITLYKDGQPDEIFIFGYSGD